MDKSAVNQIKDKILIEDIVSEHVDLQKAGKNLKGCCPFHNEKTPSFFVSPERNSYYCFGCGAKGDIFTFSEEINGSDFKEALRELAQRAGVSLENQNFKSNKSEDILYEIMDAACTFFEDQVTKSDDTKKYLIDRGISAETKEGWRIGYAPNDWHELNNFLKKEGYKDEDMIKVGLIKNGERGVYDHFRDRVMFPIFDNRSRVIAYSGRLLHDDGKSAKYINSPETILFNKSEVLYGLHGARSGIRKLDFAIMVEGQFDVVLSHQMGFENTIATSGTSATEEHFNMISKLTDNVILAYDGDKAGIAAAKRAWEIALPLGMNVKMAILPEGEDPADIIKSNPEDFKNIIKNAKHVIEFTTSRILEKTVDKHKALVHIEKFVLPLLKFIKSHVEKNYFVTYISQQTGIKEDILWHETSRGGEIQRKVENKEPEKYKLDKELEEIVKILGKNKDFDINLIDSITKISREYNRDFKISDEDVEENKVFEFEEKYTDIDKLKGYLNDLLKKLELDYIKKEIEEAEDDMKKVQDLSNRKQEIIKTSVNYF
jgi:DNA primase